MLSGVDQATAATAQLHDLGSGNANEQLHQTTQLDPTQTNYWQ